MRSLTLLVLLAGCSGSSHRHPLPDAEPAGPVEPAECEGHCVIDHPTTAPECCDSVTCWIDSETYEWVVTYCDPPPPPCAACTADEMCVQDFDGVCTDRGAACVPKTVDCPDNACTPACEAAYCGSPFQCEDRAPCGPEAAGAFTCYGP